MNKRLAGLDPINTKDLPNERCSNCGVVGSMEVGIYTTYVMSNGMLPVAVAPGRREGRSICRACNQVLEPDQMTPSVRAEYHQLYAVTKTPVSAYTGLFIILIIGAFFIGRAILSDRGQMNILAHPRAGDWYSVSVDGAESSIEVVDAKGDSVFVKYGVSASPVWEHKSKFMKMYDNDAIVDVTRADTPTK